MKVSRQSPLPLSKHYLIQSKIKEEEARCSFLFFLFYRFLFYFIKANC